MTMNLARKIKEIKNKQFAAVQKQEQDYNIAFKAEAIACVARFTSLEVQGKLLKAAADGKTSLAICDTRKMPSKNGRGIYSLPIKQSGNFYCAFRDGVVTPGQVYDLFPALAAIRDFYEKEGLKVYLREDYSDGGEEDWVSLVVAI